MARILEDAKPIVEDAKPIVEDAKPILEDAKPILEGGQVYIGSMNLRGLHCACPPKAKRINVTSAQGKQHPDRLGFSPMTISNYKGFLNFEAYWQSGKVFHNLSPEKTVAFWKGIQEPKRRFPGSRGKKVMYAQWPSHEKQMDYVTSRKEVYVPLYHDYMTDRGRAMYWKQWVEEGHDVLVCDFDGPRLSNGDITVLPLSLDLLVEKINDPTFPFGHGYVVAAYLAGIPWEAFCEPRLASGSPASGSPAICSPASGSPAICSPASGSPTIGPHVVHTSGPEHRAYDTLSNIPDKMSFPKAI